MLLVRALCVFRFFEDYKKNENKHVRVDEILGAEEAVKAVKDGLVRAQQTSLHCKCTTVVTATPLSCQGGLVLKHDMPQSVSRTTCG